MGKKLKRGFYWRGGVVWVRTDPITGQRRSTECSDPEAAYLSDVERQRIAASPAYAASLTEKVGDWVTKTLDRKKATRSAGTVHMYEVKLGHAARIFGAEAPLASVDAGAIDRYIEQRGREGAIDNTIARELTCITQMLRLAKRAKCYPHDLDEVLPVGFSAKYKPVTRTLKMADLPKLLAELRKPYERAWVCFVLATGADAGDVLRAEPSDYDPVRKVMRVRGTKNTSRDAEVPVLPHVEHLLELALPHLPINWPGASNGIGRACARAKLPHLSPKDLRRTAASWLAAAGADISHISRFLRHKSDTMARLVYAQISPEELGELLALDTRSLYGNVTASHGPLGGTGIHKGFKKPFPKLCDPEDPENRGGEQGREGAIGGERRTETSQPEDHRLRKPLAAAAEPGAIADYTGLTPADLADCRQIRADLRTAMSQRPGLARCSAAAWALAAVASWKGVR